jgi:hypothetical protein
VRTRNALIEILKGSRDLRIFFKGCCNTSAFRPRSQAWQFRDELAELGYAAPLDEIEDTLFELARALFPDSPGADFVTWAGLLSGDTLSLIQEHYADLSQEEKAAVDLSTAWETNDDIVAACEVESLATLREALRSYEREALAALERARERSGAA